MCNTRYFLVVSLVSAMAVPRFWFIEVLCGFIMFQCSCSSNTESTTSFFAIHKDHALLGHAISTCEDGDIECGLKCLKSGRCQSYTCPTSKSSRSIPCQLQNETRHSRPLDFLEMPGSDYFDIIQVSSFRTICGDGGRWDLGVRQCRCHPGYKGNRCESKKTGFSPSNPAHSCSHIANSGDSEGDGEYWIKPERNGQPLNVFCDMTTDGGGWLLVANFVTDNSSSPPAWTANTNYRAISNYGENQLGITKSSLNELRTHLNFTQLRFHCSKQLGTTFHVITVPSSTGEAVVQYFSGQTEVLPYSCHSFLKMADDNSRLAGECHRWGNDAGHYVGKWGHYNKKGERRMYDHSAFVAHLYHWMLVGDKWLCDDNDSSNISPGDFWRVFVR